MSGQPQSKDERELFIATDIGAIPIFELKPMCKNFVEWGIAVLMFKVFGAKAPITFASENRRLVKVDGKQIPKRVMNYFDTLRPKLEQLGFRTNYYATVPAMGPIAIALFTMSSSSGKCSFFAVRAVMKVEGEINEDGHFGFGSRLPNNGSLTTITKAQLPKPREGLDRVMLKTNDPEKVLVEHRKRMRDKSVIAVPAGELFEYSRQENLLECEDLLARGVIRPARPAEIQKLRLQK